MPAFKQANKTISFQIFPRRLRCGAWARGGSLCLLLQGKASERWMSSAELVPSSLLHLPPYPAHKSMEHCGGFICSVDIQQLLTWLGWMGRILALLLTYWILTQRSRGEYVADNVVGIWIIKPWHSLQETMFLCPLPAVCTFWIAQIIQI